MSQYIIPYLSRRDEPYLVSINKGTNDQVQAGRKNFGKKLDVYIHQGNRAKICSG